jgi:hypothetical protein
MVNSSMIGVISVPWIRAGMESRPEAFQVPSTAAADAPSQSHEVSSIAALGVARTHFGPLHRPV